MSAMVIIGLFIRFVMILLGFTAMWSLWVAKRERGHTWSGKMYDIWFCHMCFVTAIAFGNVQYFYQKTFPTFALSLAFIGLVWTVRGTFHGEMYIKEDPKTPAS